MIVPLLLTLLLSQAEQQTNQEQRASWFLGNRVALIEHRLPIRKQVVLVPDEATYLDEISKWSTTARWPVLFHREPYASQFIRRFQPEEVWVRTAIGTTIDKKEETLRTTVAQAWGGDESIEDALTALELPPTGIVFTNVNDSARTAAVALAAGRGQLLKFIPSGWGGGNEILSKARTNELIENIEVTLQNSGVKYNDIGDTIDALTVCMTLPSRAEFTAANENPVAISDVIGRDSSGKRFAWTGWIFGSKANAAYMAMCSLFLERNNYWFCNTYPKTGVWAKYGLTAVQKGLTELQITSTTIPGNLSSLQQAERGGIQADVAYFMSKGNSDFLEMSDQKTSPTWLPIPNTPTALYFIHSWSLKNPSSITTVGGTWLTRGAYAYVGSSHEPMLSAFVPPNEMLRRTMSYIPFLIAARWNQGENMFSKPWRINTIGDPLMLCPPNIKPLRSYVSSEKDNTYQSVKDLSKQAMQDIIDSPNDSNYSAAIELIKILGNDTMCLELWKSASSVDRVAGSLTAQSVLPVLFRLKNEGAFLWAFELIKQPTRLEEDMLWQLVGIQQDAPIHILIQHLRKPYQLDDLLLIQDQVVRTMGKDGIVNLIDVLLQTAQGRNKRGLERLRKEYND